MAIRWEVINTTSRGLDHPFPSSNWNQFSPQMKEERENEFQHGRSRISDLRRRDSIKSELKQENENEPAFFSYVLCSFICFAAPKLFIVLDQITCNPFWIAQVEQLLEISAWFRGQSRFSPLSSAVISLDRSENHEWCGNWKIWSGSPFNELPQSVLYTWNDRWAILIYFLAFTQFRGEIDLSFILLVFLLSCSTFVLLVLGPALAGEREEINCFSKLFTAGMEIYVGLGFY